MLDQDSIVTFKGAGVLNLEGRIAGKFLENNSAAQATVVMNGGQVNVIGIGSMWYESKSDQQFTSKIINGTITLQYQGGSFHNDADDLDADLDVVGNLILLRTSYCKGDNERVRITGMSNSSIKLKSGAAGEFMEMKCFGDTVYFYHDLKLNVVTDYYIIDGDNYRHFRHTNKTVRDDAVEINDDSTIAGAAGTVSLGNSTVSNATLTFTSDLFTGNCTTDSNGAYYKAMPQGTYQVTIKLSGSDVTYNMGTITLSGETKTTQNYALATLTGTVTDTSETPNPLSNAIVSVNHGGTTYTAVSGSDGTYTLVLPNGIASEGGTFSVTANHLMATSKTETVTYQAPNMTCNFDLTPSSSTEINVYTEDDLVALSIFADQLSNKTINLMNDITLTGSFQGIKLTGKYNYIENMTFNGNDHTIEKLTTPLFLNPDYYILYKGTVKNLHLKGNISDSTLDPIGALANRIMCTTVENCSFEGSINSTRYGAEVGGLIGLAEIATIRNSFVRLTKISGTGVMSLGGLCGRLQQSSILNSYAIIDSFTGTMKNDNCSTARGALAGYTNSQNAGDTSIKNSYSVVKSKGNAVYRISGYYSSWDYDKDSYVIYENNFTYGPSGVFGTDAMDMSHATDLTETLMTAAAGSGTGDNAPLVDRLNASSDSSYKTWYNGTDGYPCFTIPTYTITFSGGTKGTGSQEAKSVTLGELVTLPDEVYKNIDYVQKGWATSENSTTKTYALGASISPTADMTLYPYWEAKTVATGYEVPTGLTAIYGDTLSNVSLPDGFTWNEPSTSVGAVGTHTFTATYTPTDETYGRDTNVQISVEVKGAPSIYDTLVNKATNLTYNRTAQALVTGGTTSDGTIVYSLTGNDDYTSTIPTATDVEEYTVYYKIQGDANHEDSEVGSVTVSIGKGNMENAVITLGDALTYNGKEQTQSIASVKIGDMTLGAGDYTVTGNTGSDAGTYTLTVTGNGNFEGSKQATFTITKSAYSPTVKKDIYLDLSETGTKTLTATDLFGADMPAGATIESYTETADDDAIISEGSTVENGVFSYIPAVSADKTGKEATYKFTVSSKNYKDITVTVTFQVKEKNTVSITGVSVDNKSYDGKAMSYTGTPSALWNGTSVSVAFTCTWQKNTGEGTWETISEAPVNAGKYRLIVAVADSEPEYKGSLAPMEFTIEKKTVYVNALDQVIEQGETAHTAITEGNKEPVVFYEGFVGTDTAADLVDATATKVSVKAEDGTTFSDEYEYTEEGSYVIEAENIGTLKDSEPALA